MSPTAVPTPAPLSLPNGMVLTFEQPRIMGIVNVTPDSFSDGGNHLDASAAVAHGLQLIRDGADLLDVGGESTRPGAEPVDAQTEAARVVPVIQGLIAAVAEGERAVPISVDTSKATVAAAAIDAGATIVNDVSALSDPHMASVVANAGCGLVLMHMRGSPRTMQTGSITYDDVVGEVCAFLAQAAERATAAGIAPQRVLVDPGIGFGKTLQHNLALTHHLHAIAALGYPVLYGPSRKRFLGELTGQDAPHRDVATAAVCALAVQAGAAHVLRVHAPKMVKDAVLVAAAVRACAAKAPHATTP